MNISNWILPLPSQETLPHDMNDLQFQFSIILAVILATSALLILARINIRYVLTPGHLAIEWFGFRVRRFPLREIISISTRKIWWAENWCNAFSIRRRRRLVIRRRSGWLKYVAITPEKPYVFRSTVEKYMAERLQHLNDTAFEVKETAWSPGPGKESLAA